MEFEKYKLRYGKPHTHLHFRIWSNCVTKKDIRNFQPQLPFMATTEIRSEFCLKNRTQQKPTKLKNSSTIHSF